jgi:membrane-associated phospholipid phosphatase
MPIFARFGFWLLLLAMAALFAALIALGGPESQADRWLLFNLQIGGLVPAARILTELGSWWFVTLAAGAAALWLVLVGRRRQALLLAILLLAERLFVEQLKYLFDRARPDPAGHLVAVKSMAFPSGHAANAMTLGLGLALLVAGGPRARRAALALALVYALLVGLSRPVLGVHWPSDVLGGWLLGAAWTLLLVRLSGGTALAERHSSLRKGEAQ